MENLKYVLVVKDCNAHTPYRFWEWDIVEESKIEEPWEVYKGSPSLVPCNIMKQIEVFEKKIGRAIRRPSSHGDKIVMIG